MKSLLIKFGLGLYCTALLSLSMTTASTMSEAAAEELAPPGYDIIVMLGQSNAFGCATDPAVPKQFDFSDPRIYVLPVLASDDAQSAEGKPVLAKEPINEYSEQISTRTVLKDGISHPGGSKSINIAMVFAKQYLQVLAPHRKILMIQVTHGSSGLCGGSCTIGDVWASQALTTTPAGLTKYTAASQITNPMGQTANQPAIAGSLYVYTCKKIVHALNTKFDSPGDENKVVAFLWHQGETDATVDPTVYTTALQGVLNGLRTVAVKAGQSDGMTIPFVTGGFTNDALAGRYPYWGQDVARGANALVAALRGPFVRDNAHMVYADSQNPTPAKCDPISEGNGDGITKAGALPQRLSSGRRLWCDSVRSC